MAASNWPLYEKGVFDTQDSLGNHAVLLVGYGVDEDTGEKFYKVRNSWGHKFGEDGECPGRSALFVFAFVPGNDIRHINPRSS